MIKKVLQLKEVIDTPQVKKTWKKIRNAKVQRSIGKESTPNYKIDLEIANEEMEDEKNIRLGMNLEAKSIGSVIDLINRLETNSYSPINNSTEMDSMEESLCKTNQEQYDRFYGNAYSDTLKKNIPNLENFLISSDISGGLRAKMVHWMLEVVNFFKPGSDIYTLFKAVVIMDFFIKNNQRSDYNRLQDSDLHLIGSTAIFIASKYEDNRHITLQHLLVDVCKNKFSSEVVLKMEWEILLAIGFKTSIPTHLECLDSILSNSFEDLQGIFYHQIRYFAIYLLKKCLNFPEMATEPMHLLALSCVELSIHSNFDIEPVRMISKKRMTDYVIMEKHTLVN